MTTYIYNLLKYLYPRGNWGREDPSNGPQVHIWGQVFVHLFLGALIPILLLPIVLIHLSWGFLAIVVVSLTTPFIREIGIDKHPLSDLTSPLYQGVDMRSDILSCWLGSALALIPLGVLCLAST